MTILGARRGEGQQSTPAGPWQPRPGGGPLQRPLLHFFTPSHSFYTTGGKGGEGRRVGREGSGPLRSVTGWTLNWGRPWRETRRARRLHAPLSRLSPGARPSTRVICPSVNVSICPYLVFLQHLASDTDIVLFQILIFVSLFLLSFSFLCECQGLVLFAFISFRVK